MATSRVLLCLTHSHHVGADSEGMDGKENALSWHRPHALLRDQPMSQGPKALCGVWQLNVREVTFV